MNIDQAKTEIKRTVTIYLMKDAYGNYRMSPESQRPVFMIGAPGIGKTACVAQAASEMDLPLVSYTMTHHTRQSAVGLPEIRHRTYQGKEFDISVYTLSEIIASVYETMERTDQKEGILFLDEINCVSETLAPAMLQFLQYKTFGNHSLPAGWIIVAAGNPREFNRNARSFDIATLDRLKVLNIEPDYKAWKQYAASMHVHPSVLSYLDIHPDDIFHVESSAGDRVYVTPRGWEDLSKTMLLYEENNFPVDETLIRQYLHDERIVNSFSGYLTLYEKYQKEYPVEEILSGNVSEEIRSRMQNAGWDEKISVTDLLLSALSNHMNEEQTQENSLKILRDPLRMLKNSTDLPADLDALLHTMRSTDRKNSSVKSRNSEQKAEDFVKKNGNVSDYSALQAAYREEVMLMNEQVHQIENSLHAFFAFLQECGGEQTLLIAITYLTSDETAASFISVHGCDDYYQYSRLLSFSERNDVLQNEVRKFQNEKH